MYIFSVERPFEGASADFATDLRQTAFNRSQVFFAHNIAGGQHARVCKRTVDIKFSQPAVEIN